MNYVVVSAMKTREYDTQYGKNVAYAVMLEGETEAVEVSQKVSTPAPQKGDELAGTIETTSYGRKFKKDFAKNTGKYSADPKKLEQEFKLEVAKNLSIQRQVAVKGAVDLIVAGKMEYKDLGVVFDSLMGLLNPKLHQDVVVDAEDFAKINPTDFDEPPIESYDE